MKNSQTKQSIIFVSSDSSKSGVPVHLYHLINGLKKDYLIRLICPQGWLADEFEDSEVSVFPIDVNLRSYFRIRDVYKFSPKNTIIHIHGVKAGLVGRIAARGLEKKVIYSEHNWTKDYSLKQRFRERFQIKSLRFLSEITDRIICVSNAVKDFYLAQDISKESKLTVIYNGVNFYNWEPLNKNNIFNFSVIGTLDFRKGIDILIRALKLVVNDEDLKKFKIKFNILGSGVEQKNLENLARKLDVSDQITWHGNEISVEELFSKTDIYVQPSRDESFGMALCESVGSGIPSIAANVGAIPEILDNEFLFEKNNEKDLYEKLKKMILNYDKNEIIFRKNRTAVQNKFSIERMIKEYKNVYEEIAATKAL